MFVGGERCLKRSFFFFAFVRFFILVLVSAEKIENNVYGAKCAYNCRKRPEYRVLKKSAAKRGNKKSAEIKDCVKQYTGKNISYSNEYRGQHCAYEKAVAHLEKGGEKRRACKEIREMPQSEQRGVYGDGNCYAVLFVLERVEKYRLKQSAKYKFFHCPDCKTFENKFELGDFRYSRYQRGEWEIYDGYEKRG